MLNIKRIALIIILSILLVLNSKLLVVGNSHTSNDNEFKLSKHLIRNIFVEYGINLGNHVINRISKHLKSVKSVHYDNMSALNEFNLRNDSFNASTCAMISFGNSTLSSNIIQENELNLLPYESFRLIVTSNQSLQNKCKYLIVTNGLPLDMNRHKNVSFNKLNVHYGSLVGSYTVLEMLGFRFLHPLQLHIPSYLYIKDCINSINASKSCEVNITESPYWPERSFHIHTQHPVELTEVLQGFDIPHFGPHGSHCLSFSLRKLEDETRIQNNFERLYSSQKQFNQQAYKNVNKKSIYCERFEDMVDDVNRLYEWAIANRLNKLEWLLLGNHKWGDELETRMKRFKVLTNLAHSYSLLVGADCPLVNQQQHAWYIVDPTTSLRVQYQAIRDRVDWIFTAGFDFLTTESGLSEFTHPECHLMLSLMNQFSDYVNITWGREAGIKVHCSTNQYCSEYLDPTTGEPINFNFLTLFAHSTMGVFPHTIQVYSLNDPTAGAYGNENFSYIEDYMVYEAKHSNRSVSL